MNLKVVTASTPEQQQYVRELIVYLYEAIFPSFFSKDYIQELTEFNLMDIPNLEELHLAEIMEVTAAIQTIITILEALMKSEENLTDYKYAFSKNASILSKYNMSFPFELSDFDASEQKRNYNNSFYI